MDNEIKQECSRALTKLKSILEWIDNLESSELEVEDEVKKNELELVNQDV